MLLALVACGGGGGGSDASSKTPKSFVSGTVAAGAPVVGIVNVLGANGLSASSFIESDGSYSIDVTLLTAPFILFAEGSVNGKGLTMYSASVAAGNVNITPITDFILRNALAGSAEAAYTNWTSSQVSATALIAAETNAQQQIEPVLNALGIDSNVDLISTPFSADQTGIDMVLEVLTINYSGTEATVTNSLTGSSFTDDLTVSSDNSNALPAADTFAMNTVLTDQEALNQVFQILENLYATIPPTVMQLDTFAPYVADDFLDDGGINKTQLLDGFANDDGLSIGFTVDVVIDRIMDVSATSYDKGYWVRLYYTDSEESDSFLTTMVFDGVKWLWYGDRTWSDISAKAHASMNLFETFPTSFQTGYELHLGDELNYAYNQGVRSAIVTGPGLPASGVIFEHLFPETQFAIYLDINKGNFYSVSDDAALSVIQDNAEYVFTLCSESAADLYNNVATCTALQTYTDTVIKPPVLNSELNASMFISLTNPLSHDSTDVNFGGLINVSWITPENTEPGEVFLGWTTMGTGYQAFTDPLPGATSVTLDTIGLPAPGVNDWASIFIRTTDIYDRDFNMGWTFF